MTKRTIEKLKAISEALGIEKTIIIEEKRCEIWFCEGFVLFMSSIDDQIKTVEIDEGIETFDLDDVEINEMLEQKLAVF